MELQEIEELKKARHLARAVGEFIRYWGFRNIHGEIWAVLYLANRPLSGKDLTEILDVSKALVSPALHELVEEGLILPSGSDNSKTKRYEAIEDVMSVIRSVLNRRERPMMKKIIESHRLLGKSKPAAMNTARFKKIGSMIKTAQLGLHFLAESGEPWL